MSYLVELYVPATYNDGSPTDPGVLAKEADDLVVCFGGLTIVPNARGFWKNAQGEDACELVYIWRVVCETYDAAFWAEYKKHACELYRQEEFLITVSHTGVVGREGTV